MSALNNYIKRIKLTQEELKKMLQYNPETGIFTWKVDINSNVKAGDMAGSLNVNGYRYISIKRTSYKAHRLAWLYMKGTWPKEDLDHVNRAKHDNSWINLREATRVQNKQNTGIRKDNRSGARGVSWHLGKWQARITIRGKLCSLGHFDTLEEAKEAYEKAASEAFGSYYNGGGFDHQGMCRRHAHTKTQQ